MEYEEEKVHTTTRKESNKIRQLEKPSYTNQNKKDKSAHRWRRISKKKEQANNDSYREPKQDKRRTLNTLNVEYTQINENKRKKTHTHSKVPANRRNESNLK